MTVAANSGRRRWRDGHGRRGGDSEYPPSNSQPHDEPKLDPIETFNGPHKWLSNFSWSTVDFEGERYPSVEHAFQAAKLKTNGERRSRGFTRADLTFGEAKRLGRQVPLRDDWREIREDVMYACLESKFADPVLRSKLLATGDRKLIDGHSGSPDLIWGYHIPSQAGENRLGKLLMDLRSHLRSETFECGSRRVECHVADPAAVGSRQPISPPASQGAPAVALYHLDWPMKCLNDGLPPAYAKRIAALVSEEGLGGCLVILPQRRICIGLRGTCAKIDAWEHRMRTEAVDVNSRGRPCRERMLVELLRSRSISTQALPSDEFVRSEVKEWVALSTHLAKQLGLATSEVKAALGPEFPPLPKTVLYTKNREAVLLDGISYPLCLNDSDALEIPDAFLGPVDAQFPRGLGIDVPLAMERGKRSIFGGKFARTLRGLLDPDESQRLIELSEHAGFGLAGSRGFNPFARFALRCLVDMPQVADALSARLSQLLPTEYPPGSGRPLIGVNERLRFLKYLPGMHHCGDHTDCAHEDKKRGRSFLTLQLYLNSSFCGGRTTFISDRLVPVEPTPGGAVVFDHELYHRGGVVTDGTKYAVRLDVLYGHPGSRIQTTSHYKGERTYGSQAPPTEEEYQPAKHRGGRWAQRR
eukprot:TRINITY_DN27181_c0_g1_i1.p1 TRINITY_DN27181_c0_g1~~TRINITY_DN27181_c0_g1_i1.p1  ORF type:complete len:670 (+),score=63.20 TRINITY_DN27181_c0_g1_i1:85-2010(+)